MTLVFVDTETTGLDPDRHEIWEVAYIVDGDEHRFTLPVDLSKADPGALRVNNYYKRPTWSTDDLDPSMRASEFACATAGAHLVGAVPSFDAAFLDRWLRRWGYVPAWHYHLVDVEALAAGALCIPPPWNSEELSLALGVQPPEGEERHTALADARWAQRIYVEVMSHPNRREARAS